MLEAQPVLFRRSPSRRRMLRPGVGTDNRGWTSLHVKGDFKLVSFFSFINPSFMLLLLLWFLLLLLLQNPSFMRQALLGNLNNNAASNKFNVVKLLSFFVHLSVEWELAPAVQVVILRRLAENLKFTLILIFADSDSASSSRSDSVAWPMCGVLPKKMICFMASFECATSIHGLGSVAVNMICCFILDGFFVAGKLLEEALPNVPPAMPMPLIAKVTFCQILR
ncbi:hypothetical protein AHAS_Ahas20G0110200 [Arachis hypogaea]